VVAELDRSTLATKLAEVGLALQKADAVYQQAMLDSTLNLSKAREVLATIYGPTNWEALSAQLKAQGITVSTVGVGSDALENRSSRYADSRKSSAA